MDAINLFSEKLNKTDDKRNQATVRVIAYPCDRSSWWVCNTKRIKGIKRLKNKLKKKKYNNIIKQCA